MGKGDRKTKKGKISKSSFGKLRPRKQKKVGGEIKVEVKKASKKQEEE